MRHYNKTDTWEHRATSYIKQIRIRFFCMREHSFNGSRTAAILSARTMVLTANMTQRHTSKSATTAKRGLPPTHPPNKEAPYGRCPLRPPVAILFLCLGKSSNQQRPSSEAQPQSCCNNAVPYGKPLNCSPRYNARHAILGRHCEARTTCNHSEQITAPIQPRNSWCTLGTPDNTKTLKCDECQQASADARQP